ncbi:MAG: hypothetical protein K2N38_14885 [Oscillospiraceae bacterium]|nr:hypothetical protein [Oscillospiraceae bacterium]
MKEFIDFAKNCSFDKWSHGKSVKLAADIDLSDADFAPIPIFGGTFDGGGHTVSGMRIDGAGSHQGMFRYLEKNAAVKDLHSFNGKNFVAKGFKSPKNLYCTFSR